MKELCMKAHMLEVIKNEDHTGGRRWIGCKRVLNEIPGLVAIIVLTMYMARVVIMRDFPFIRRDAELASYAVKKMEDPVYWWLYVTVGQVYVCRSYDSAPNWCVVYAAMGPK